MAQTASPRVRARPLAASNGGEKAPTQQDLTNTAILAELARLGGNLATEDALEFTGKKVILPESMSGDINAAIRWLSDHQEQQETSTRFDRIFKYRPLDGAHALQSALKKIWGTTGIGGTIYSFFGNTPPTFATIDVGVNKTDQVPEGKILFAPLEAEIIVTGNMDRELGPLFRLVIDAPRKYRGHIEGLFTAVEAELRTGSIYKGQAITGAETPTFIDLSKVDPARVIYSDETIAQLAANVWAPLQYSDTVRKLNLDRKRAVLLEGPYGTGKTLAAYLTGQIAVDNGWTFIFCRPGQDDFHASMRTALLYAPAVVFFEDVDVLGENGDPDAVTRLLDLLDGIGAKNQDIMAVLSSNHPERLHQALLRPGRLDAIIHIGELDAHGIEQLVLAMVPADLLGDINMAEVCGAMEGYLPSFAVESIGRAMRYAVSRIGGMPSKLTTSDFVEAARGLQPQLALMAQAAEGVRRPGIESAYIDLVREATDGARFVDSDGDAIYGLAVDGKPGIVRR